MANVDSFGEENRASLQPSQVLSYLVGAVYLVIGVIGFFITGFSDFTGHGDDKLLGFMINPLHNLVHVVIGILGLAMAPRLGTARIFGWILFVGYGALFLWGLGVAGDEDNNPLNLNWADNWLHLGTALVGLLIALWPARTRTYRYETAQRH